jgi:hypothetical protein
MLADDRARRGVPDIALASAIALVAGARTNSSDEPSDLAVLPVATAQQTRNRVRRLLEPAEPIGIPMRLGIGALAVALVAVPTVLLFTPFG